MMTMPRPATFARRLPRSSAHARHRATITHLVVLCMALCGAGCVGPWGATALADRPEVVLSEEFATDAWQERLRQGAGGPANTLERTSAQGRTALLLQDNDPQGTTILEASLDLPQSGRVSGLVLIPSHHAGMPNASNAYFAVQLLGGPGGPRFSLAVHRSTGACAVAHMVAAERATAVVLPDVVQDDVWVPWQVSWEWDGVSDHGQFRVAVFDKETDPLPFDAAALNLLRIVCGWSAAVNESLLVTGIEIVADGAALDAAIPDEYLRRPPFQVAVGETVLADTFGTPDPEDPGVPLGWYNWKPETDPGRFLYDHEYGRRDTHSVCLDGTFNAVWQKKVPARPGATYRFSGWVRVEQDEPHGTVSLAMQPRVISAATGEEAWANRRSKANRIPAQPGYWQYMETFWTAPASGDYIEGRLALIDVEFIANRLRGRVWCDDVRLEEVGLLSPWREGFEDGAAALEEWRVYGFHGLEGQAEVAHEPEGFAGPGALRVTHLRGQAGLSGARLLPQETFGALRHWTVLVHATGRDGGVPALNLQQLDEHGNILGTTGGDPEAATRPGWREHRVTFALQARTARVRVMLTNNGAGSALFDNLWLRPAQADEMAGADEAHPVMLRVFPADVIAEIEGAPAVITFPSGQAGAFNLHLYGDRDSEDETRVEVEAPDWLTLRTAHMAIYGAEPLEFTRAPAEQAGRSVYTFTDPYPWQRWQRGTEPNPYTGLFTVWHADAAAGAEGTIVVRTFLGEQEGQARELRMAVRPPISRAPELDSFTVGIWNLAWLHVPDEGAHRELLQTYVDAGIRVGSMHETQGYAAPVMTELGFTPAVAVMADIVDSVTYRALPEDRRPPLAVTFEGEPTNHFIALGVVLNDPAIHAAYKARLQQKLRGLPPHANIALSDIEFWGDGSVSRTDFHPSTIAEFRRRKGIPEDVTLTPEIILREHFDAWSDFRNDVTAELHGLQRQFLRELRPDMTLWAYDYPLAPGGQVPAFVREAPMNSVLYEPHIDGHLVSYYNREGVRFLDSVDNDARHLTRPVWAVPFLMTNIDMLHDRSYNYAPISARELRFELVGAAASGARGHLGFTGQLMDADFLHAYVQGVTAIAAYESFYARGERQDDLVRLVEPAPTARHRVHALDGRRLLTLFNGGVENLEIQWEHNGRRSVTSVPALDFAQVELR